MLQVVLTQPPKSNPIEVDVDLGAEAVTSFQKVSTTLRSPVLPALPQPLSFEVIQVQDTQHLQSDGAICCLLQQSRAYELESLKQLTACTCCKQQAQAWQGTLTQR